MKDEKGKKEIMGKKRRLSNTISKLGENKVVLITSGRIWTLFSLTPDKIKASSEKRLGRSLKRMASEGKQSEGKGKRYEKGKRRGKGEKRGTLKKFHPSCIFQLHLW